VVNKDLVNDTSREQPRWGTSGKAGCACEVQTLNCCAVQGEQDEDPRCRPLGAIL
jgi:hypothetical protein